MLFTFFAPRRNVDPALDDRAYKAAHATQTRPDKVHDLSELELLDYIRASACVGRAGDGGYIISGDCTTTRKEGGEASFVLIDYDDNPAGPDWQALDAYAGFAWTTASGHPHWRVLIPLLRPMAHGKLHCPFPGGHIRNRTQPAFLPTHRTDVTAIQWRLLEGTALLDGEALGKAVAEREPAASSMLGAVFTAAGLVEGEQADALIVRCPWQHEHTGGAGGGCVVFHDDDAHTGLGKFYCAHGHCSKRGSADALDALRALPAAAAELEHWPEPGIGAWERVASPPCPLVKDKPVAWLTGAALAAPVPDVSWLVQGLELAPGRSPIIAADSGSGKSWSVQSVALSVASGMPVFGRFPCRKGPVFHVAEDSDINATLDRYQRLAHGMGLSLADLDLAVYAPRFRVTGARGVYDPRPLLSVLETAAKNDAALVIIDSLATVCVGLEENSPEIALPLYDSRHPTIAVLWTHHTNRGSGTYRGSSALKAAAGAMWAMSGEKDAPRIWTNEKHAERTTAKDRLDTFATTWDGERIVVIDAEDTSRKERPADRMSKEILTVMERNGVSSKTAILELVGGSKPLKTKVFDFLVYSRVIEHVGSRYTRALGVPVPRLPDEAAREVFSRSNAHRKTQ